MKKLFLIPPFDRKVVVLTGTRNLIGRLKKYRLGRELTKLIKDDFPTKDDEAFCQRDSRGRYILWFKNNKATNDTINHEISHLLDFLLDYVGERKSAELRAYYTTWLRREVRKRL